MDIRELASILQSGAFTRQQAEALLRLFNTIPASSGGGGDGNVDGGVASSIYLPSQVIDGGSASG